jgi:predicted RNA methylase
MSRHRAIEGGLDKFYTNIDVAKRCVFVFKNIVDMTKYLWIEPSAGKGVFIDVLKEHDLDIIGYDLYPDRNDITTMDFLTDTIDDRILNGRDVCFIGNPPFGFAASAALKFVNKAATYNPDYISFILPATFKKKSILRRVNSNYHILVCDDLPKNSFNTADGVIDVPTVFIIFEWRAEKRDDKIYPVNNEWIEYVDPGDADFIIKRVGGRSGQVFEIGELDNPAITSHYFCKEKCKGVKNVLRNIDFDDIRNNTAGVRSISKREIILFAGF